MDIEIQDKWDKLGNEIDSDRLARILDSLDYIEKNLRTDINLDEAARRACLSRFRFQRVFAQVTGMTPGEYLRSRRLSQAAEDLLNSQKSIEYLSSYWGYENFSSFTRAFGQMYGQSPRLFRNSSMPNLRDGVSPLSEDLLRHWNLGGVMNTPILKSLSRIHLIGPAFSNRYEDTLSHHVNEVLAIHQENRANLIYSPPTLWLLQHGNEETIQHRTNLAMLAVQRHEMCNIPKNWLSVTIPSGSYRVFEHRGSSQELFNYTARFIWERWWRNHDKSPFDWVLCRIDSGLLGQNNFIESGALYLPENQLRSALLPWETWSK